MLSNLKAEMARFQVSPVDLGRAIGRTDRSIRDKINGVSDFTVPEGTSIRNRFFPGMSLEYLFCDADQKQPATAREKGA